jgi:hypothetical protein
MCLSAAEGKKMIRSESPEATDSSVSSHEDGNSSSSSSPSEGSNFRPPMCHSKTLLLRRNSSSLRDVGVHCTVGTLVSLVVVYFSVYFPFLLAPMAALQTYHFAVWKYQPGISFFDNTAWTYGTDYFLAISMLLLALSIPVRSKFVHAGWRSRGLMFCCMWSTAAGGIAHQFYMSVDERNSLSFRCLWTVCVGTVTAASGFMGAAASELLRLDPRGIRLYKRFKLPIVPDWFWAAYAFCVTATVAAGGFSFQRPACDIFIAGITQFPSTFYMMILLVAGLPENTNISKSMRLAGSLGFILNAPLLPLYPLLIVYTNWSLATVNTFLHTWLLVAWSLQGLALRHFGNAVLTEAGENFNKKPERKLVKFD